MQVFFLTLVMLLIVFAAMSIGFLVKQKSIAGSCGGLGALGIDKACNCDSPCDKRLEKERQARIDKEEAWKKNKII
jgi:hypothetical protein